MADRKKITDFVDSIIAEVGDPENKLEEKDSSLGDYIKDRMVEIFSTLRPKRKLLEFTGPNSLIRMDGDNVVVKGKVVGTVETNLEDFDASGIEFRSSDGKFSKEFNTAEALYRYLADHYNIKETGS